MHISHPAQRNAFENVQDGSPSLDEGGSHLLHKQVRGLYHVFPDVFVAREAQLLERTQQIELGRQPVEGRHCFLCDGG